MSDEMVMRTADSPAAATGDYAADNLYDSQREPPTLTNGR